MNSDNRQSTESEPLRDQIAAQLELMSHDIAPDVLSDFIGSVESLLSITLKTELLSVLRSKITNARVSHSGNSVQIEGNIYILDISEYPSGVGSTIRILLRPATPQRSRWPQSNFRAKIDGYGHFSGVSISVPKTLVLPADELVHVTKTIYETGYEWLLEFCQQTLATLTDSLSIQLYGYLRRIFSGHLNPALADSVYLGLADSSGVIYLFDHVAAHRVVTVFQKGKTHQSLSPLVLSSELLTSAIDFEKSFNKEAIALGDGIDVNLADARYFEDEPIYDVAERLLLATTGVSFFPITVIAGQCLSCWFPTSVRADVLPILKAHKVEFAEILSKHKGRVRKISKTALKKSGGDIFARIAGRFSAAFMKEWFDVH